MSTPTEDEVRAWLESQSEATADNLHSVRPKSIHAAAHQNTIRYLSAVMALLDEARKDRERLDWLETTGCYVAVSPTEYVAAKLPGFRAAIDQARGA